MNSFPKRSICALAVLFLVVISLSWSIKSRMTKAHVEVQTGDPIALLAEANRLSWLGNWYAAGPLYQQAEERFHASGDTENEFVVDASGGKITLPRGASDAALSPYHVDRSKIFAAERLAKSPHFDVSRIAAAIEMTRFPAATAPSLNGCIEPKLVQAADLIGQLGDPMYPRKANALYSEFEEVGMNRQLGYSSPADIIDKYPAFYWNCVSPHIEDGIRYLNMTSSGRQWVANLHNHILCAELAQRFMGPQR